MKHIIVGAGPSGVSTAYWLSRMGEEVIVLEKGFLGGGNSTRNAGRFRVHFRAEENVVFAVMGRKHIASVARTLPLNPVLNYGGYLWLLASEEADAEFRRLNEMWRAHGFPAARMGPEEVGEKYPFISTEGLVAAYLCPQDGALHHDYLYYGMVEEARRRGAVFVEGFEARDLRRRGGKWVVSSPSGVVKGDTVLIAAGAWTPLLLEKLGISVPVKPVRKEIAVTEPFPHTIEPLVIDGRYGVYYGQTLKGELIGSVTRPSKEGYLPFGNTFEWLVSFARAVSKSAPRLSGLRIMRHWSGYYAVTPDHSHIMGRAEEWPPMLHVLTGFSGHGMMMSVYAGRLMALHMARGIVHEHMRPFLPTRFQEGKLVKEVMVIG